MLIYTEAVADETQETPIAIIRATQEETANDLLKIMMELLEQAGPYFAKDSQLWMYQRHLTRDLYQEYCNEYGIS